MTVERNRVHVLIWHSDPNAVRVGQFAELTAALTTSP